MSKTLQSVAWAIGIIIFALLGVFGFVRQDIAEYGVIALPALAAVSIFAQRSCAPCKKAAA